MYVRHGVINFTRWSVAKASRTICNASHSFGPNAQIAKRILVVLGCKCMIVLFQMSN